MGLHCTAAAAGNPCANGQANPFCLDTRSLPKCTICDVTSYKEGNNANQCTACPTGLQTTHPGATSVDQCLPVFTVREHVFMLNLMIAY